MRPIRRKKGRWVPLTDETKGILEAQLQSFREKFGRDPGPGDPIFFDPQSDEPRPFDPEDYRRTAVEAMQKAGINPALIYAFSRTGLIVTEENLDKLSKADLAEWKAALDEYEELKKRSN